MNSRTVKGLAAVVAILLFGAGYLLWRGFSSTPASGGEADVDLSRAGTVVLVDASGVVRQADRDGDVRGEGPKCQRAYAAVGTLACLRALSGRFSSEIEVYDSGMKEKLTLPLWGIPSRTQVSPSGNLVAWTVFREGDSYLENGAFSTTAGAYNLDTGEHYGSLEDFTAYVDGEEYGAEDVNYWGITFADDDRTFYATMSSAGKTWLMRGDLADRTLTTLRQNVECPSLSPDGDRIAYKKRGDDDQWRLHVLDLDSGEDVTLAETDHVDDQPAWLDDSTVAYSKPHDDRPAVFSVPADGAGEPRRLWVGSSPSAVT
ncbi:MAG: TolB family protein [Stackebrandtia sp.]